MHQDRLNLREKAFTESKNAHEYKEDERLAVLAEAEAEEEGAQKEAPKRIPFDEASFQQEFDIQYPAIQIPNEVQDEVDNDFDLPYTAPSPSVE